MTRLNFEKNNRQRRGTSLAKMVQEERAADARFRRTTRQGFPAKYAGTCPLCHGTIHPGERIQMWSRPKVAHRACIMNQPP